QDDGRKVLDRLNELGVGHAGRAQHDRVAAPADLGGDRELVRRRFDRVCDEHAVSRASCALGQRGQDGLEGGVGEVGHDERDGARRAEREASGERARGVVEGDGGRAHALGNGLLTDEPAIHHAGHRGGGDPGVRGDPGDRRAALSHCHLVLLHVRHTSHCSLFDSAWVALQNHRATRNRFLDRFRARSDREVPMSSLGELRTIAREARRKGKPRSRAERRREYPDNKAGYLFLLPWLIGLLVFTIGPIIASGYLSFTDYNLLQPPVFTGLDNFAQMLQDQRLWNSFRVTLVYVFVGVPLQLALALAVALLLDRGIRGLAFYRSIFYLPSLMGGSVAIAILWRQVFGKEGLVNAVLGVFSIE